VVDIAIIISGDFTTCFIIAASTVGALFVFDIGVYAFWTRNLDDYHPYYTEWLRDMTDGLIRNDDMNLNGIDDDQEDIRLDQFDTKISQPVPIGPSPARKKLVFDRNAFSG
jgi:hypothetical protein